MIKAAEQRFLQKKDTETAQVMNKWDDRESNAIEEFRSGKEKETHTSLLLSCLPEDNSWAKLSDFYSDYCQLVEKPVCRATAVKYLSELEQIGEIETQGNTSQRKYRKVDLPVEEVREKPLGRHTEGLPSWMEKRIEKAIENRLERLLEERADKLIERVLEHDLQDKVDRVKQSQEGSKKHLLETIEENGEISSSQLYTEFFDREEAPDLERRTLRKYLSQLRDKGLIRAEGQGRWRTYVAVDAECVEENLERFIEHQEKDSCRKNTNL